MCVSTCACRYQGCGIPLAVEWQSFVPVQHGCWEPNLGPCSTLLPIRSSPQSLTVFGVSSALFLFSHQNTHVHTRPRLGLYNLKHPLYSWTQVSPPRPSSPLPNQASVSPQLELETIYFSTYNHVLIYPCITYLLQRKICLIDFSFLSMETLVLSLGTVA